MTTKKSIEQLKETVSRKLEGMESRDTLGDSMPDEHMLSREKKRGRPKGSKNRKDPIVDHIKPMCCKCKSANLKHRRTVKERVYPFTLNGVEYESAKWCRVVCLDCRQNQTIRYLKKCNS